jgi:RNA polymerase sigma-70 factor (sigma-E family)
VDVDVSEARREVLGFDQWVDERFAGLLRFAYLVTGSQHAAEDALQTALTRALERWSAVSRARDPDAYVRRMVVNAHISAWRRTGARELVTDEVRGGESGDLAALLSDRDDLWRRCLALPPRQRAALVLRFYEDLDYPEVAAALGVGEATARSHVHRALTALRQQQEEDGDE